MTTAGGNVADETPCGAVEPPAAAEAPLTVADEARRRLDRRFGVIPARLLILALGFVVGAAALSLFAVLAVDVYAREAIILDDSANAFLYSYSTPLLDALMGAVSFVGAGPPLFAIFLVAAAWLLAQNRRREAVFLAVALLGGTALNQVLKLVFQRPRPALPWSVPTPEYSFPSGHSMISVTFYLALAVVIWVIFGRRSGIVALVAMTLLVVTIGVSRIYLGYHYFSDVVGGFSAGLVWLITTATAVQGGQRLAGRRRRMPTGRLARVDPPPT